MTLLARKIEQGEGPTSLFFLWQQALHSCIVYNIKLPTFILLFFVCLFVFFPWFGFFFSPPHPTPPFSRICELVQEC